MRAINNKQRTIKENRSIIGDWLFVHLEIRSMAEALEWNATAVVTVAAVQTDLDRLKWKTLAARSSICHHRSPFHYCGQLQESSKRLKRYTTCISIFEATKRKSEIHPTTHTHNKRLRKAPKVTLKCGAIFRTYINCMASPRASGSCTVRMHECIGKAFSQKTPG